MTTRCFNQCSDYSGGLMHQSNLQMSVSNTNIFDNFEEYLGHFISDKGVRYRSVTLLSLCTFLSMSFMSNYAM